MELGHRTPMLDQVFGLHEGKTMDEHILMDPLDKIMKNTVSVLSVRDHLDKKSPLKLCPLTENGMSVSFQDFGRESLGILPADFGKESSSFLNMNISDNKELGLKSILNISEYGRDSLESGRESLGILQINKLDLRFGDEDDKNPEILLTAIPENDVIGSILDTAFLFPSPRKALPSSISTQNSGYPSFSSCSLEEPSKIYSLSRSEAASCTSELYYANSDLNNAKLISPSETEKPRVRMNSMPDANDVYPSTNRIFWSTGKTMDSRIWLRRSFLCGKLDFNEDKENILHDSILIEGNHIAQKIADGSILNDGCGTAFLDNTSQPNWPSDLDESKSKEIDVLQIDCNTVFKKIDKMLPETQANINIQLKTSNGDNTPTKSKDAKEMLQNLSEILNNTHRSDQQISLGQNLISSLAEILCEGSESHVPHLDDSGHSSFIEKNDLSDKDKYDYYEVLDLSKKSVDSKESRSYEYISNVSVNKLAKNLMEQRLSQSLCSIKSSIKQINAVDGIKKRISSVSRMDSIENKISNSNSSVKSNDSQGSGSYSMKNISGKFKTKPGAVGKKKGPLRAVIPVKDMKRNASNIAQTPEKFLQCSSTSLQSKRTSTPINEPKLKPMAASTPTIQQVNYSKNASVSNSKLSRANPQKDKNLLKNEKAPTIQAIRTKEPSKIGTNLNSDSSSTGKTSTAIASFRKSHSKLDQALSRRNSTSEIKIDDIRKLKRSNSVGKETGLMSSLSKVRENLLKSPYFDIKRKGFLTETNNNGCEIPGGIKSSVSKPINMVQKAKKIGKENIK